MDSRMQAVQSSIISLVGELIRQSPGTISLGQGVVYYPPPTAAFEQISQFLAHAENHKYQPVHGIIELRSLIAAKLQAENGIAVDTHQIVVTAGGNMAFNNAILAITQPGDEVILPVPYYFNHEMAVAIASCRPVLVPTDENYQLDLERIERAITDKTKAIVTVSPNNPTGVVYPPQTLLAINELCRQRGIYHISDEAYEYFTYDGVRHFSPGTNDPHSDYTISLFSLSKAYGFASWRIGYMVIPEHLIEAVNKIQDTILICPPVISQYAALGALTVGAKYCQEKLPAIAQVRQFALEELQQISDICTLPPAEGAFFLMLKINTPMESMALVEKLIREYQVAVLPGTTFGLENGCYLRVAYGALQAETAVEGIGRLVRGLRHLITN